MLKPDAIGFRLLATADLPLMHRWLNVPAVLEWWKEPLSREEVEEKYGPCIRGEEPTRPYLILYDGRPIGYIQTYRVADHPEYDAAVGLTEPAAGVDLFIGEDAFRHRGLGPAILRRFLLEIVFPTFDVVCCVIGPEPANRAAIRAYEKAGFRYLKTIQAPGEDQPEYLMRIGREEFMDQR